MNVLSLLLETLCTWPIINIQRSTDTITLLCSILFLICTCENFQIKVIKSLSLPLYYKIPLGFLFSFRDVNLSVLKGYVIYRTSDMTLYSEWVSGVTNPSRKDGLVHYQSHTPRVSYNGWSLWSLCERGRVKEVKIR